MLAAICLGPAAFQAMSNCEGLVFGVCCLWQWRYVLMQLNPPCPPTTCTVLADGRWRFQQRLLEPPDSSLAWDQHRRATAHKTPLMSRARAASFCGILKCIPTL